MIVQIHIKTILDTTALLIAYHIVLLTMADQNEIHSSIPTFFGRLSKLSEVELGVLSQGIESKLLNTIMPLPFVHYFIPSYRP
jgi:hypothetical protein